MGIRIIAKFFHWLFTDKKQKQIDSLTQSVRLMAAVINNTNAQLNALRNQLGPQRDQRITPHDITIDRTTAKTTIGTNKDTPDYDHRPMFDKKGKSIRPINWITDFNSGMPPIYMLYVNKGGKFILQSELSKSEARIIGLLDAEEAVQKGKLEVSYFPDKDPVSGKIIFLCTGGDASLPEYKR